MKENIYPDPICMICGKKCEIWEEVYTGDLNSHNGYEMWCYCPNCKVETFHPAVAVYLGKDYFKNQHSLDIHPLKKFEDFKQICIDVQFVRISWPICIEIKK